MKYIMLEILIFIKEEAVSKAMTSEEIACHFGYDKYYFSREFKNINGFSVSEYISSLKAERAIIEMDRQKKIIDLQNTAGFESSGSFTNTFKRFTGISPKNYQKQMNQIYDEVKNFEENSPADSLSHYEGSFFNTCDVDLIFPETYQPALTFEGLFYKPIPNHRPVVGIAKRGKGSVHFKNIPDGEFYLMACSVKKKLKSIAIFRFFKWPSCKK